VSARYYVLVSDHLMVLDLQWPEGLRPVERAPAGPEASHGMHRWLFEDDGASPSLEGHLVELTFSDGGASYGRRMVG